MTITYGGTAVEPESPLPARSVAVAMRRGALGRCPACGEGRLYGKYLKVEPACAACGEAFHHHRADDFPPYVVMFIVGHIGVSLMLWVETTWRPDLWIHALMWGPIIIGSSLALLPPVKGAIIGLQWARYMHGFDPRGEHPDPAVVTAPAGHGQAEGER